MYSTTFVGILAKSLQDIVLRNASFCIINAIISLTKSGNLAIVFHILTHMPSTILTNASPNPLQS